MNKYTLLGGDIMETRKTKIYPTEKIPALQQGTNRETVPFRWLSSLVDDIRKALPDERDQKTCMVHGVDKLTVTYEKVLTASDIEAERTAELKNILAELRDSLPPDGSTFNLSADQLRELKRKLSGF